MTYQAEAFSDVRVETRFVGTADFISPLPDDVQEIHHPSNVVTTVVFGRRGLENDNPVPLHGSLRFRYYSSDSIPENHRATVLDPKRIGTFMLKYSAYPYEARPQNQKHNLTDIALGDVCAPLEHPCLFNDLAQYDGGEEMIDLILKYYGDRTAIMPLMAVQAERRHFFIGSDDEGIGPARLTFDQRTTFWPLVQRKPGDVLAACKGLALPHNVLEVKRHTPLDPSNGVSRALLEHLFGNTSDYTPVGRLKRALGKRVTATLGTPTLLNSELQATHDPSRPGEVLRSFNERESKIDTTVDPRDVIKAMPTRPRDGIWVDPGFPTVVRFRFHSFEGDDGPVVAVEKHKYGKGGEFIGSGFQHKRLIRDGLSDGVLVRKEVLAPSLPILWEKTGQEPGALTGVTQFANRNRHQRRVVCEDTGNVFLILADHCCAELDDRPPLSQVEIEYLGILGFEAAEANDPNEEQIAKDFERIRGVVLETLDTKATGGQTTKQEWLTADFEA